MYIIYYKDTNFKNTANYKTKLSIQIRLHIDCACTRYTEVRRKDKRFKQFLQFTVGTTPSQIAFPQGVLPTTEQNCCTVGRNQFPDSLSSILLPTVNCRNSGDGEVTELGLRGSC